MMKTITWFAKCLFLYLVVAILSIRFSWIFVLPVWSVATRFHWTELSRFVFLLNYFLPIFAGAGFILGLVPFERLGRAVTALVPNIGAHRHDPSLPEESHVPVGLWAWVPVTIAFLFRYFTWHSRNTSVLGTHAEAVTGRFARFFGNLNMQNPALLDPKWASDRFIFTGPMLFLMAWALATLLRRALFSRAH